MSEIVKANETSTSDSKTHTTIFINTGDGKTVTCCTDCGCGNNSGPGSSTGSNVAFLVPENTTWDMCSENVFVTPDLPKSVGIGASLVFDSPFGRMPCNAVAWLKGAAESVWSTTSTFAYERDGSRYFMGILANCPGDGKVYLTTGNAALNGGVAASGASAPKPTAVATKGEIVIGLFAPNGSSVSANEYA